MQIKTNITVFSSEKIEKKAAVDLESQLLKNDLEITDSVSYPPLINSHDHLIGNWVPRAGKNRPYTTTDIWVEEMKDSISYLERNKIWKHDGSWDLTKGNVKLLTSLGIYKNIFSGCIAVQDHEPKQKHEYYENFPIKVIEKYTQCHSLSLGNWWGGKSAREEWLESRGEMPFILHLAEGTNQVAKQDFAKLETEGLLQPNTLIIHGISLTEAEIKKCADAGTSICICPGSNIFLIDKTIDVKACQKYGVNLVLGTDSTMSGNLNLLHEIKYTAQLFPELAPQEIYKMCTENASKALFLPPSFGRITNNSPHLLVTRQLHSDPFVNLTKIKQNDIKLLVFNGKPIFGDADLLSSFQIQKEDYFLFSFKNQEKFVYGHPEKTTNKIDEILGYHKNFPYLAYHA